jgi:hypothetical protein
LSFLLRNKEVDSNDSTELDEEVEQPTSVVRNLERVRKRVERSEEPNFHSTFVLTATDEEPKSVGEAIDSAKGKLWKDAMVEELESFHKNETWDLVELPSVRNLVGRKWVFKKKMNTAGQVEKFKSRLVVKGYSQVEGVEFGEIFSPAEN